MHSVLSFWWTLCCSQGLLKCSWLSSNKHLLLDSINIMLPLYIASLCLRVLCFQSNVPKHTRPLRERQKNNVCLEPNSKAYYHMTLHSTICNLYCIVLIGMKVHLMQTFFVIYLDHVKLSYINQHCFDVTLFPKEHCNSSFRFPVILFD